ncbi:hypothetical protein KL933_003093 [Ogataea haglerorum]|uniref:2-dehydropantolactone reductase n=1 Tax=Ogataea haglerorum TaxID=1937702 RepID=A0AAN6D696_9ASCO|nr:uncharacterized protein KL911_000654 [Ogataea haglerorum]KAG7693464.1 hypothetical protein KL951_004485 [Ogataea haglerorum]KAG7701070.1 hypothetical protein KL915_000101 [Ogataea haglerorum]KAG7706024.1 hypothetical protein KL950_003600 [Ogataea haglerorum]KAG7709028.1 hypothetical protein KL914_001418 [Ogataea haglerorum]KAG7725631.1 hypothetical protein KL948_004815 [Ogataea haglerorum]
MLSKLVKLNNGSYLPYMGLGTWELTNATEVVKEALKIGYRLIDTAVLYGNEKECAQGVLEWMKEDPEHNRREHVCYITKLWTNQHGYQNAKKAIKGCLEQIDGLKYIDLLLIHAPTQGKKMRLETYQAMQEAVDEGVVKSIGVSNYGIDHLKELLSWPGLKYKPVANEIEVSPWCMRQELCNFCRANDIAVIAYAPFSHANRINDPDAVAIAKKKGVTPAQVLVRWSIQKGYIPIPKTKNLDRLATNFDVLSFELSDVEMKTLDHPDVHDPSDWEVTTCP